jgi:hypothetical protein
MSALRQASDQREANNCLQSFDPPTLARASNRAHFLIRVMCITMVISRRGVADRAAVALLCTHSQEAQLFTSCGLSIPIGALQHQVLGTVE